MCVYEIRIIACEHKISQIPSTFQGKVWRKFTLTPKVSPSEI
jgi:hypothetical protein